MADQPEDRQLQHPAEKTVWTYYRTHYQECDEEGYQTPPKGIG
jgi:hypothetical protein